MLVSVVGDLNRQSLLNIMSITFPLLESASSASYLDDVPVLRTPNVPNLRSMRSFHLGYAQNLTNMTLNSIENVLPLEINDV
jgi:hypothetical protein